MSTGAGIMLILVGAILAFAVQDKIPGIDLVMIGYICMACGVLALLIALVQMNQRRRTEVHQVVERRDIATPPPPRDDYRP